MKKLLSTIVALATAVISLSVMEVYAEGTTSQIQIETVSANAGEDIDVAVTVSNNPGIINLGFTIDYDTECLELISAEDCKLFPEAAFTTSGTTTYLPYFMALEANDTSINYTENGDIVILHFHVLDGAASGMSEISINVEQENTFDINLDEIAFESVDGGVKISGADIESTTTTTETATMTTTSTTTTTTTTTTTNSTAEETTTTKTTTSTTKGTTITETTASTTKESTTTETTDSMTEESTTTETTVSTTEETTITESTVSTTEEITTSETNTSATETTIVTTVDINNYFTSVEEMCEMASKDYEKKNGTVPAKSEAVTNEDGTIAIQLKDANGKILCTYTIDPVTGIGTDNNGKEVNLPQTGNNSLGVVATATAALAFTVTGAFAVIKSGVIRRKKEDK